MMEIRLIRHNWPERAGFTLHRPVGAQEYVLLHFHNQVELFFNGCEHITHPGALIIFSPGKMHRFISREPLLHDWMHITGPVREEIAVFGIAPDTLYQPGCGLRITELVARLEAESFARRSHWQAQEQALLTELWVLLSRDHIRETVQPVTMETADRLRTLRAQMLLHPELAWSNKEMARQINFSVSRLYPLYHRMFSISPNHDLILIRVEKAKNMLMQGETVTRTAECLGYSNVSHFIRQFRQCTGISPGRYGRS